MTFKTVDALFQHSPNLQALDEQFKQNRRLLKQIRALLPLSWQPHCRYADYKNEELILYVSNSTWANLIYFYQHQIKQSFPRLRTIKVKVVKPLALEYIKSVPEHPDR